MIIAMSKTFATVFRHGVVVCRFYPHPVGYCRESSALQTAHAGNRSLALLGNLASGV